MEPINPERLSPPLIYNIHFYSHVSTKHCRHLLSASAQVNIDMCHIQHVINPHGNVTLTPSVTTVISTPEPADHGPRHRPFNVWEKKCPILS